MLPTPQAYITKFKSIMAVALVTSASFGNPFKQAKVAQVTCFTIECILMLDLQKRDIMVHL